MVLDSRRKTMRKAVSTLLLLALVLGVWGIPTSHARAAAKPLAVVTFSGYDELIGDINYVGRLSDNPNLGKNLEGILGFFTRGRGLAGLDKTRPWGAAVQIDGDKISGCVFLPVTDLDALLEVVKIFAKGVDQEGDLWRIKTDKDTLYVKKAGDWAFVANKVEMLEQVPADPMKVIGDLNQQYDVAVRLFADNVPQRYRQEAVNKLRERAQTDLERKPEEKEEEYLVRKIAIEGLRDGLVQVMEEIEQVTIGWALDNTGETSYFDVTASARKGTDLAAKFSHMAAAKTNFSGFTVPGAALTASWAGSNTVDQAKVKTVVDAVRKRAFEEIESQGKPEAEQQRAKNLLGQLLDVVQDTVAAGKADGGMSVLADPNAMTFVAGGFVSDGMKLEQVVKQVVEILKNEAPHVASMVELDADRCQGVNLHRVTVPIPPDADDRDKVVQMIGESLEVIVGMGGEGIYVAAGRDAMQTLKKAIASSAKQSQGAAAPLEIALALHPIAKLVAAVGKENERADAAKVAAILEAAADADHVKLTVTPIERGARLRFELEEGILRLIGKMSTMREN
jgi:hypothetical protein